MSFDDLCPHVYLVLREQINVGYIRGGGLPFVPICKIIHLLIHFSL